MPDATQTPVVRRFGSFEINSQSGELRKNGIRLRLSGQPFQVLVVLLARPGEVVSREELHSALWPADTFVDFDHGLNNAVARIREVLDDSSDTPRYVETIPRRGYRFIALLADVPPATVNPSVTESIVSPAHEITLPNVPSPAVVPSGKRAISIRPKALLGAAALLAAFLLLGLYMMTRSANAPAENVNIVPLTSYPGAEQFPSFSPDGNEVAFAWTGGEYGLDFDLYRKQVGSEKAVRLTTTHARTALAPAWSPDGRYIAYIRVGADYSGLYLVPALGGPERKLSDVPGDVYDDPFLSWSPDSKWLAFPSLDNSRSSAVPAGTRIFLLNIETLERRILAYPSSCIYALGPAFSPAGDQIASYCADDLDVGGIYIQSVQGVVVRKFQRLDGEFAGLTWTSDGKSIVYSFNRFLWRVAVIGGLPQKLQFGQNATAPTVARVGARLAYAQQNSWRNQLNIWRLDLSTPDKAKNAPVKVISSSRGQEEPRISPDGKRIAFLSARSGNPEIWVADSDGSNLIQLTSFGGPTTGTPRWSPDSRRIAFDSRASGRVELYVVDADGGPARRLPTDTPNASMPFWSHNGRWIYFSVIENKKGIWKVPAEGGAAIQLTADQADVPQESFDGSRVFYESNFHLRSVSVNGGDEQEYNEIGQTPGLWFIDRWTTAPNGIYFLNGSKAPATLNLLNLSTGKISHVSDISGRLTDWGSGPSLSADGHTLMFATADRMEGDLMLVEGFH
jgi:Tol biopolymer transport system component/DNA-binding winged helix-turn-helix (wHTH) protein